MNDLIGFACMIVLAGAATGLAIAAHRQAASLGLPPQVAPLIGVLAYGVYRQASAKSA